MVGAVEEGESGEGGPVEGFEEDGDGEGDAFELEDFEGEVAGELLFGGGGGGWGGCCGGRLARRDI